MTTLSELQADLAKLKKIRGSGVLKVRLADGKETTFASLDDLRKRIADTETDIARLTTTAPQPRTSFATFRRD
jgi:hypothetical protein